MTSQATVVDLTGGVRLRRFGGVALLLLLLGQLLAGDARGAERAADPYDVLYDVIMTRHGQDGKAYGADESMPSILSSSAFPFDDKTYKKLDAALDAFAAMPQEKIEAYSDIKRALLQRHLWHVFDVTVPYRWRIRDQFSGEYRQGVWKGKHPGRRDAVRPKLASLIQRLALTKAQILALPDTAAATVDSGGFALRHDPVNPFMPFLPPQVIAKDTSWVSIDFDDEPPAPDHSEKVRFRSAFLTLVRLPGGRGPTVEYLEGKTTKRGNVGQFPVGTQFAFFEQALLISDEGELVLSPLTISISMRAYLDVERKPSKRNPKPTQSVAEFVAQPRQLMRGHAVMKALSEIDVRFEAGDVDSMINIVEPFEKYDTQLPSRRRNDILRIPRLHLCMRCHGFRGVDGVGAGAGLFGVKVRSTDQVIKRTLEHKRDDDSWKALKRLWSAPEEVNDVAGSACASDRPTMPAHPARRSRRPSANDRVVAPSARRSGPARTCRSDLGAWLSGQARTYVLARCQRLI